MRVAGLWPQALCAGLAVVTLPSAAAERWGAFSGLKGPIEEIREGLTLSLSQSVRFDDNLVRTSGDAETLLAYGTDDASDLVSNSGVDLGFVWSGNKTRVSVTATGSYAQYSNFDQFSDFVWNARGDAGWQFTERCRLNVGGSFSRDLQSFVDLNQPLENLQTRYNGSANVGCFLLSRVRLDGGVNAGRSRNEVDALEINDIDDDGWSAAIAYVTAQRNEIGLRYRTSESSRPNNPAAETLGDEIVEGFLVWRIGQKLSLDASAGVERQDIQGSSDTQDRTNSSIGLNWAATERLSFDLSYRRDIENATDLSSVTRLVDGLSASASWRLRPRVLAGLSASLGQEELDGGTGSSLTGLADETAEYGAFLSHRLFEMISVRWQTGYSERTSDDPSREYESAYVSVGLGYDF